MKDNNNVYERAKALVNEKQGNTIAQGSVYERAKALIPKSEEVSQYLDDLGTRISANAETLQSALAHKDYEKAKADTKKMLEESTLNTKPYPTSEDAQKEVLQGVLDEKANEARARGMKDYLDSTIGAWNEGRVGRAGQELIDSASKPVVDIMTLTTPYNGEKINVADMSFKGLPNTAKAEASKIVKDYLAENPHMEANKEMLENYVAGNIYNDTFKWKLENDEQFFADAFEATHGIKYKDFLKKRVNEIKGIIKDLRNEAGDVAYEQSKSRAINDLMSDNRGELRVPALEGFMGETLAEKPYEEMLDKLNDWEKNNFASGFAAGFDWSDFLSLGMADLLSSAEMSNVLEKANRGEKLYGNEERLYELAKLTQELETYRDKVYESQGVMSKIGEGVGTSVEMLPEFAIAMTGTGMIGSFAKLGGKTALKAALKAGGKELFKYGVKTTGKLGYNFGLAKVRGLAAAPIMPSTYNTYLDSLNSAYKFDDEGNLTYTPVDKKQAALGAVFSTANEISSEYLGAGIGTVVGWGARGLGRMVAGTKLAEAAVGVGKKVRKHLPKFTPQAKVAMRTLGVQADPVSETLSEALGDIMTSYEQTWIGMDVDKSEYGTMDYWMTLAGVTLVYGGSMAALGAVNSYRDVKKAVKVREDILAQITDRNLHDALVAISTSDDVVMASAALADMNWEAYGEEAHLARAYVAADLNVKILEGAVEEESRLDRFRGTIEGVRNIVYQGKAGEYSDIIREAEMDGKKVYIINGYEANTNQYIVVDATTGEKTSVDKSKVTVTRELDVDTYIQEVYQNTFSLEAEKQRVADVKAKALQLDNPTEKDVARVASTLGIKIPKVGTTVMLANGNMGAVTEVLSPTEYAVQDPSGATYKVHFTDILSTDKLTATAQGALARGEVAAPIAPAEEVAQPTEVAETTTEATETTTPDDNGITIGAEVPVDGRVGKVRARTQDGKYAVAFEAESGSYEDTEVEFFTGEELASLMGIAPMPTAEAPEVAETAPTEVATTENGSVDVEQMSAEDAAKALIQRAGTIEEAIAQVKQVIETVAEERKKTAKAEKKASLNDIGKKSAELQALDTRLEFYSEVLGVLEGMLAEQQEQTMTEAQNIAEEAGVAPETTEATDTTTEQSKPVEQPTSGLIRNGAEMKFTDNVIKMVDFVAKRLGITVEFVDGLKNEAGQPINGDIAGKRVRISTSGTKGVKFIMGHEFFHRMKDLVDEQTYADFVNSIKEYAGEKVWKATMAHQRNVYRNHNARVAKEAMTEMSIEDVAKIAAHLNINIEGLSLEDAKDAVARGAAMSKEAGVAEVDAIFPTMLSYDDALMVEECAADVAGGLVTNTNAFAKYVEDNSSNIPLVRGLRKAIRAMREFFDSFGYTEQQRKFNALEKNLASVLNEAAKKEAKAEKKASEGKTRNSLQEVEESAERLAEQGAVVNTESGDVRFSLQETNDRFNAELTTLTDENARERILNLGRPSSILLSTGIEDKPIRLYGAKLLSKLRKHGYDISALKNLPLAINLPIAVFEGSHEGSFAILTELKIKDNNVLAALSVGKGGHDIDFNIISSVYDKRGNSVARWVIDGKMLYADKKKALDYFSVSAPIAEAQNNQELISVTNIIQNFENPKISAKYSLQTPTFYSNAEFAVRGIKQEKATPEQWLKMIEKAGGLKAGEDKWLGLSDWLKASDKKTLSKDEVLQYIADNNFVIEEVEYSDVERFTDRDIYDTDEFTDLLSSLQIYDEDDNASFNIEEYNRLRESNADFEEGFSLDYWGESLDVKDPVAAARYLGLTEGETIHGTRLAYTTTGLENKREIALVVPSIEPYNKSDEIHFGDAGGGRAVAWIRFGETEAPKNVPMHQRVEGFDEPFETATGLNFYAPKNGNGKFAKDYVLFGKLKDGSEGYIIYIDRKPISKHDTLEDARNAMNEYYEANPLMITRYERVLVIDEIQSKRHQDARDKGYIDANIEREIKAAEERLRQANKDLEAYKTPLKEKYGFNEMQGSFFERLQKFHAALSTEENAEMQRLAEVRNTAESAWNEIASKRNGVPSAPFEKNWAELAMKRMLRYAAENGFDKVAWTTGEQQAERYDLGTKINHIHVIPSVEERYVSISPIGGRIIETPTAPDSDIIVSGEYKGKTLSEVYGKALAEKIMSVEVGGDERISGDGLRIGGEGMKGFYDQMLPSFMNKYGKKWGVKVGEVTMPNLEENNTMHSVDVNDAMRESVMQGQPRFSLPVIQGLSDALNEYKVDGDIASFVEKVREVNDKVALGHPMITSKLDIYDEDGDAEWFVEKIEELVGDFDGGYAPYTAGGVRYSLPTDLLTDFADEFKALQDEYASLDPATIDYKHPFRVHKREVVQKYVDHVADVLGLSCETFVIDAEDDAQVVEAFDRYKKSHQSVSQQYPHRTTPLAGLNDFKAGLKDDKGKYATGLYFNGTDFILMIISGNDGYNEQNGYLQVDIHENVHGAMEALGITDFEKEMVLSEAEKHQPKALKKYLDGYDNVTDATKGEEIVAYAINSRLNSAYGKLLLEFFEGGATLSEIWKSYNLQLPLRLSLTRKILNYLKDGYEAKNKISNNAGGSNKTAAGSSPNATNSKRFASKYLGEDIRVAERWDRSVDTRFHLPDPDPSDVFYDEIPIFDEQGNEVDITTLTSEEAKEILDGKVRQMLEAEYDHAVVAIRKEAEEARQAVKEVYRAEKEKRRKGAKAARTNAARIDEIFGDTPFESLPYEVQALILIATGQAKIYWGDRGNKRGLASELGLTGSTGDRHAYRNIWGGAKKSFNEVVHDWWESIGGQERGIDDQDLRNALISALQSVQSSRDAMQEIINKYDDLAEDRDNTLAEIDRNEEKELYEAKTAYEQHLANFELSEGEERTAYHDRAAQFFGNQSLSRVDDILEDLTNELERSKRKIERLKAEKKDVYTPLAESIQHAKDTVLRALERLRMFAGMEEVDLNDVARLINLVKASRSQRQIEELGAQATALVQRVSIKKAKTNLMRLLSLKLSNTDIIHKMLKKSDTWTKEEREAILKHLWKVSRNGLRVSKAVHKDTKEIVDELKSLVDAFRKNELKGLNNAQKAKIIEAKLADVEKELHPEVVYDSEGNVQDNADLPTDFNAENKHLAKFFFKSYLEMLAKEMEYHNAAAELREKIDNKEKTDGANAAMVAARENYLNALNQFNSSLESLILEGKDKLRDWNAQKEQHEIEIRSMGIRAIGGKKASGQGKRNNWVTRQRAKINTTVNAPYWTFETVLEKIDHNSPYKKGKLYTYFMDKWADANDDLINRYAAHMEEIAEVMRKCFPDDAKNILKMKRNPYALYQYIMRKAESTPIGTLTYKEMGENGQMRDAQIVLNVANAMYVIAMWRQPRYQEAMQEKHGITQGDIDALMANIASVNAGFLDFMDWVNETFLPSTRLEYDVVYRKMNGGSMPKEINYFPARVAGHKEVDLANIDNGALPTTPSALKDRMSAHIMPQLGMDYFKVLESHIQDMDNWAAYAELTADLNVLLSSDEFRRRCNDYMGGLGGDGGGKGSLYDLFKQTSLIATGMYRGEAGLNQLLGQLQKAWATSNIAFRGWTAVKQISSITTGMFDNWAFYKHAGIAATGVGIYHEIKNAMEISPSLRYRWKSGAAGMEALARETQREDGYTVQRGAYEKGKDFIGDAIKILVRAGMTPNAAVDLLACSIIVNSVYETEIARLTGGKREATEEEKRAAVRKAERAFNTTQQSSEGAYLAPVQANPAYGVLTTYMNASFALHRKRMGGIKELWKLATSKQYRRYLKDEFGVDAAKISAKDAFKDILSGVAGELSFAMMGWGLMEIMALVNGWLNDDDDDEDVVAAKQEVFDKWWKPILPMLNGYLFGSAATSWASGFDASLTPAYDEFVKDVKGVFDDSGNRTWEVAQMAAKYLVGIDLKALQNIGAGLEAMFEDDERAGAVLKFLNAPNRYIKAFVGDRREGETLEEYQTRIIRFHSLLEDVVYEHYFDKEGNYIGEDAPSLSMSKNQAKALRKEYEAAYAKNVLYHYGGEEALADYLKVEKQHKDICDLLGWSSTAKVSDKKKDLTDMHYALAKYQDKAAYWEKKRKDWVGSEDYYYDLLMDEQKAKNDLINNYYEYIKQTGLGAY